MRPHPIMLATFFATTAAAQLPAIQGAVAQYSLTPRGDVDGVILADGTLVHLPPHLGPALVAGVHPGDQVTIHGLHARAIPLVQALTIHDDATDATITDDGPPAGPPRPRAADLQPLSESGRIKADLYGPRGDLDGVLLDDGTQIHLTPPEAERLQAQLAPGATIAANGRGYAGPLGRSIGATEIGPDPAHLVALVLPPPPPSGPGPGPGAPGAPGGPDAPDAPDAPPPPPPG